MIFILLVLVSYIKLKRMRLYVHTAIHLNMFMIPQ